MALTTSKIDLDSLIVQLGQVAVSPTANTVLDRLKQIQANTLAGMMGNFTTLNSTNTDLAKIDLDSINTQEIANLIIQNDILASNGLPVASPIQYTLLDRLKTLGLQQLSQVNTYQNQLFIKPTSFIISKTITRSANTTSYTAGQIINNVGSSILPYFDFTTLGYPSSVRNIEIKEVQLTTNNVSGSLNVYAYFMSSQITGSWTDGTLFNPSYSNWNKTANSGISLTSLVNYPNGMTSLSQQPVPLLYGGTFRNSLDSNGFLYFALTSQGVYTTISSQIFDITIKGNIL